MRVLFIMRKTVIYIYIYTYTQRYINEHMITRCSSFIEYHFCFYVWELSLSVAIYIMVLPMERFSIATGIKKMSFWGKHRHSAKMGLSRETENKPSHWESDSTNSQLSLTLSCINGDQKGVLKYGPQKSNSWSPFSILWKWHEPYGFVWKRGTSYFKSLSLL